MDRIEQNHDPLAFFSAQLQLFFEALQFTGVQFFLHTHDSHPPLLCMFAFTVVPEGFPAPESHSGVLAPPAARGMRCYAGEGVSPSDGYLAFKVPCSTIIGGS